MKVFNNVIKRIDEIQMPEEYKPMVISVMQKFSETFDKFDGLQADFEKLFKEKLFNNLKIEEYSPDTRLEKSDAERGCYIQETNTIFLQSKNDDAPFCHEFIHFVIHNLYPEQYNIDTNGKYMPMWVNEAMTQRLTNEVMGVSVATAYGPLVDLTHFIERNIGVQFSFKDFLNGEMPEFINNHNLLEFEDDLNHFTHNYTTDSGYEARSRVIAHYYEEFINKQLSNPNLKLEELIKNLAEYEAQSVSTGEINPFTIDYVGHCLQPKERAELFDSCKESHFAPCLLHRLIFSKGVRGRLNSEQQDKCEWFVRNSISAATKKLFNEKIEKKEFLKQYTKEELLAIQDLQNIKKMLNDSYFSRILEDRQEKEEKSFQEFMRDPPQAWVNKNIENVKKNINNINRFKELFKSSLFLTKSVESPRSGNSYWMLPIFSKPSKDTITSTFEDFNIEILKQIAQPLQHGHQCNVAVRINGEYVPIGNIAVAGDDIGITINWQGVWQYLPEDIQSQIKSKISEKHTIETKEKF